jgi:hypothetical protein
MSGHEDIPADTAKDTAMGTPGDDRDEQHPAAGQARPDAEVTNAAEPAVAPEAEQRLAALLADLETLRQYLDQRGRHTYELAQRFLANATRDPSSRQYDERQATMLEYQHYIWHEIAGRVAQLLAAYTDAADDDS